MTVISSNAYFEPHKHLEVGLAVSHLRNQRCLVIGSGGAVHNLYRLHYGSAVFWRDTFKQEREPEQWALDFGQAVADTVEAYSGPRLRRALMQLMESPQYRDAHVSSTRKSSI